MIIGRLAGPPGRAGQAAGRSARRSATALRRLQWPPFACCAAVVVVGRRELTAGPGPSGSGGGGV